MLEGAQTAAALAERLLPVHHGRTPAPRLAGGLRPRRGGGAGAVRPPGRTRAEPRTRTTARRSTASPPPGASPSSPPTTTSRSAPCGSSPDRRAGGGRRVRAHRVAELEAPLRRRRRRPCPAEQRPEALVARRCPPTATPPCRRRRHRSTVQLCQHHCPVAHVAAEFPAALRGRDRGLRAAARHPRHSGWRRIAHGDGVCTTLRARTPAGQPPVDCSPDTSSRRPEASVMTDSPPRARRPGPLRVRLGRLRRRRRHRAARPLRGRRARHLGAEERARVDAGPAAQGAAAVRQEADADLGRRPVAASTSTTSSTSCARPRSRRRPGRTCPTTSRTPTTGSASPRPRSSAWSPASPRSTSPRSSTTRSARTSRSRASSSSTPTPALREHAEIFQEYFGTVIPAGDNKFAALNTAVWSGGSFIYVPQGRARRDPAAGLLPDQHREHGPVRADADHRRRGRLRALRRGLHRADLLPRLAALGGRRDHREEGRPLPLHDDPELVEQRLQPGHQAGGRARGRDHGVGRRQHRLQGHDEVPGGLAGRRARQGRDAVGRVRGRGPAPGRRRQDGARRAATPPRSIISKSVARGGGRTSYRGLVQIQEGAHGSQVHGASATRCWSTTSAAPTPTPTSTSARTTWRWATRPRSPRSARTSSST